jgi:tetratricopeptide (TPR) repeat protein
VRLDPYSEGGHYTLGNGYARKNYTELFAAYPDAFADASGRHAMADADSLLGRGDAAHARAAYATVVSEHPGWADARVRLASLDFAQGHYAEARDACFDALRICPEYGRAHATLAKALESQRFAVDVHRADYEQRFAAQPMPEVPGIDRFVLELGVVVAAAPEACRPVRGAVEAVHPGAHRGRLELLHQADVHAAVRDAGARDAA